MDGVEYYGYLSFLKAGLLLCRRHHHRQPQLCRRNPDRRRRHGHGRPAARPRRRLDRHPQRHRHRGLGPGARRAPAVRLRRASTCRQKQKIKAALQREMGLAVRDDLPLLGDRQPPHPSEGARPGARRSPQAIAKLPAQLVVLGSGEQRPGGGYSANWRAPIRPASPSRSASTKAWRTASRPAPTSSSCPRASSPAASTRCTACATARRPSSAPPAAWPTP